MEEIVIVGLGGHGRSVADTIERNGRYTIVGYTSPDESVPNNGYQYLGTDDMLVKIFESGVRNAVVGIGQIKDSKVRRHLYERLKEIGFELPVIVDESAVVSESALIGEGTFIGKGAIVNVNASVGKMCIINSGALCEHDAAIADFTHIAVGAILCGDATVGSDCLIGANATLIQGVRVANGAIIGAGSVLLRDVAENEVKYGIVK